MQWLSSIPPLPLMLVRGVLIVVALGALLFACALVVQYFVHRHWFRSYGRARELLYQGGSVLAEACFRDVARVSYGFRRTVALSGVAVCRLKQGAYAEAAAILEPLTRQPLPRSLWLDELALYGHLALCLAMLGETRRASRLIHEACRRFNGMPTFLVMPWVAILCRDGHLGAALKWLDESWPLVVKDGLACDRIRLLRAYAQSKVDPERHAASIILTLYGLAPFPKVEMEFFREHWPVFADFLQRGQDLVADREQARARRQAEQDAAWAARARPPVPEDESSG
ncbi:hypothetical protein JRI60_09805 [Archangium violaceum]|uniref:hypothetical protein n=1 Tax=Archangium violaceum TaxID=83451 RepID=UPI0019520A0B|nr:hypothetical protein [Archangium violaceum]QRN99285.1 hypothetical protein JRI60_09805 [Archangium violaceum]